MKLIEQSFETWYKIDNWHSEPDVVIVTAETDKQVTINNGLRFAKTSNECWIRKNKQDAIDCAILYHEENKRILLERLVKVNEMIIKLKGVNSNETN